MVTVQIWGDLPRNKNKAGLNQHATACHVNGTMMADDWVFRYKYKHTNIHRMIVFKMCSKCKMHFNAYQKKAKSLGPLGSNFTKIRLNWELFIIFQAREKDKLWKIKLKKNTKMKCEFGEYEKGALKY